MNKICIGLFLLAACAFARPINEGNELFRRGDFAGALEKYGEARKDEPANPLIFYNMGTCAYKLGDYETAQKELESAMRMPDSSLASKAAFNLANTFYRIGEKSSEPSERISKWREAVGYLKKAIDLNPDFENAKRNVEIVQRKLKEEIDRQKQENQNNPNERNQPELSDAAKRALARALQMCKDGAYSSALKEGPITMLGIAQDGGGRLKFVIGEGMSERGPIPPTGNTNTRGHFDPNIRDFIKKWVMAGPTHHYALGIGHRADTVAKIAEILGIDYEIIRG